MRTCGRSIEGFSVRTGQSIWTKASGWQDAAPLVAGQLVLVFGSVSPVTDKARWAELRERYPDAILLACSTGGEIRDISVIDESLCVTSFDFARTKIAGAVVDVEDDSYAAGKQLAAAFPQEDLAGLFVLADGTRANGSELVRGLREVLGTHVVITGGLAGDGPHFGTTFVGLNDLPSPGKAAAVGFYGDALKIGHGSSGGWDVFGPERHISKASSNVLYELDGQPALDLYKRYLGEDAANLPSGALLFPLQIYPTDRPHEAVVRTIVGVSETDRSMTFAGDMPEGYSAQLMRGNFDRLIEGAAQAAEQAKCRRDGEQVAILVSCIGRRLLLGQRIDEEVEAVRGVLGERTRLTGFYSYGEVSPHRTTGYAELHNQTMTVTLLSEDV